MATKKKPKKNNHGNKQEKATADEIQRARNSYQEEGCIEIDDDALVSRLELPQGAKDAGFREPAGFWVQAWVWVENEDGGD